MTEIDLTFIWRLLLTVAIIAFGFIFKGDILPWIMSRLRARRAAQESAGVSVHVPVQPNQYGASGIVGNVDNVNIISADTDAADDGTDWQPRLPRYPTEEELVIYLATIREKSGKYLRSANQIAEFSKLHRNEVLRLVREVRDGVPQFTSPEIRAAQARLEEIQRAALVEE